MLVNLTTFTPGCMVVWVRTLLNLTNLTSFTRACALVNLTKLSWARVWTSPHSPGHVHWSIAPNSPRRARWSVSSSFQTQKNPTKTEGRERHLMPAVCLKINRVQQLLVDGCVKQGPPSKNS